MGLKNQFLVFFLSGCFRQVLLYITSIEYCTNVQYNPFIYRILHECSCFIEFIKQVEEKWGVPSIVLLFPKKFNKFNHAGAYLLESIYHMTLKSIKNGMLVLNGQDFVMFYTIL